MTGPLQPAPAATVLLIRDHSETGRVEVFMERRHLSSGFVGGAYVFPGGRVDPADDLGGNASTLCPSLTSAEANSRLGLSEGALDYHVAALRECFEEAGVLLAYDADGTLLDFSDPQVEDRLRSARDQLNASEIGFADLLERENLTLAADRLFYWSHWVTPVGEPRRYDTRFFVAEAPNNQTATHDDWELTSSAWVEPGEALDKALAGEWLIIFPTLHTLKRLEQLGSTQAALKWAAGDQPRPINQPKVKDGRPLLPGEAGYEEAEEDITGLDPRAWTASFQR